MRPENKTHPVIRYANLFRKRIDEVATKHPSPKQDFFGASPNIFVGRYGYPNVNIGFLSNEHVTEDYDDPKVWVKKDFDIPKIATMRSYLVNSNFNTNIKSFNDRLFEITKEVGLSDKPVDVEVNLTKKPVYDLNFGSDITPFGPNIKLKKAQLTENPHIPQKVEKVHSDTDLKANDALEYLKSNYDEHYLTKILSSGSIGIGSARKLVPTRWSITAVDDTLSKSNLKKVKDFEHRTDYEVYVGEFFGNNYIIMFFPEIWSYELFETYMPTKIIKELSVMTDYEGFTGRREYASNTVGGYYATRLPISEFLLNRKRQGSVLVLRFVTDDYYVPLGVWVVRQAVRKSLSNRPLVFSDKQLMLEYVKKFVRKRFNYDVSSLLNQSRLLKEIKNQTKLSGFF